MEIPSSLKSEQAAVEAEIRDAFRGVGRDGGVSWSESRIVDLYGYEDERVAARAKDVEGRWEDLVDDQAWRHDMGVGGFNFLDPIGYRYYIAPAMIRCAREGGCDVTGFALDILGDFKENLVSLINDRQARAIARLVLFMIAVHEAVGDDTYGESWKHAYEDYWRQRVEGWKPPGSV